MILPDGRAYCLSSEERMAVEELSQVYQAADIEQEDFKWSIAKEQRLR
jgi:hypothetical protein